jgi:hypothetical protein
VPGTVRARRLRGANPQPASPPDHIPGADARWTLSAGAAGHAAAPAAGPRNSLGPRTPAADGKGKAGRQLGPPPFPPKG